MVSTTIYKERNIIASPTRILDINPMRQAAGKMQEENVVFDYL